MPWLTPPRPALLAVFLLLLPLPAVAVDAPLPAVLEGHAVLPAMTRIDPPADAPNLVRSSGKFTGPGNRRAGVEAAPGSQGGTLPVPGQPLQGISSLRRGPDGSLWGLSDNGFGAKANSADALLPIHRLRLNWQTGAVERLQTLWLSDPDRRFPWPVTLEGSETRYLTGADLDPESLVVTADGFWVGDEFGPWLLRFDRQGRLQALYETEVDGRVVRSPDHPQVRLPATPDQPAMFEVGRSRGFEGLTASADGTRLYALLEGPVWNEGQPERWADGKLRLRWLEFDPAAGRWTGQDRVYPLEAEGNAIGEATLLPDGRLLVLERDEGEGDAARACVHGQPATGCFRRPARFKRLYLLRMEGGDGSTLIKQGHVDLLAIPDPERRARQGGAGDRFRFPFATIESVVFLGDGRVVVANDNNLPFSAGRAPDRPDDTEFILLRIPALTAPVE
ncbi:esterase-like activity of phytase family protein [Oleisolibacter albus]|uniref:esterase-like activity of phytase family protein n=1 Tax=Oleisolibacter albus TaxID=2171757 RepID=UPI000DF46A4E|nr:esterase-like activity of phytase family protein [Oleisolibacter albus]